MLQPLLRLLPLLQLLQLLQPARGEGTVDFPLTLALQGTQFADQFSHHQGHISGAGAVLHRGNYTIAQALAKCVDLPACHSVTMFREPRSKDEALEMFLKGDSIVHVSDWTTYLHNERAKTHSQPHHAPSEVLRKQEEQMRQLFGSFMGKREQLSEVRPEDEFTGSVRNVVATTFDDIVRDTTKDVLVNFFAPWCGHCQRFKGDLQEIARSLKHVPTLVIAQMDATRNQVNGVNVRGYPTVMLYPAGSRKSRPLMYPNKRSTEAIKAWLHSECTNSRFSDEPGAEELDGPGSGLLGDDL